MMLKYLLLLCCALLLAGPLAAQDDLPLSASIHYDEEVTDSLTSFAFWDWWHLQAAAGDVILAEMVAREPLEPLLGILNPGGTLVARSNDGAPGGTVTLEYEVTEPGEYTIVTTRVGNENGTSSGVYDLRVRRLNETPIRENPYQQVTFRCQDYEVTNAATLEFEEDIDQTTYYLISVYGLDGFEPVIRVEFSGVDLTDCARDVQGMGGNIYTLPGEESITLDDPAVFRDHAAQLFISAPAAVGSVTLTIGSANGAPGRYIAIVDGFYMGEEDQDYVRIGQGPLAARAPLTMYMIAEAASRLDPSLVLLNEAAALICDDAGRRGCEGVPSPVGLSAYLAEQDITIQADSFDAGLMLAPGAPELWDVELSGFRSNTSGRYALVLLGELPPPG